MQNSKTSGNTQDHANGSDDFSHEQDTRPSGHSPNPDQELVYRLKTAIQERGRYSFRLNDMAAGLAAGLGISSAAARRDIEDRFSAHMGRTPQEYLEDHFQDRRQNGRSADQSRSTQRENGPERGR